MKNLFINWRTNGSIVAIFVIIMCCLTLVLVTEYQALRRQMQHVVSLKEEYRNYILAVKQVLSDSNKRNVSTEIESDVRIEKKNAIGEPRFPHGVHVFSTDDELQGGEFTVVNRDLAHLKRSSLNYIQKYDRDLLKRVDMRTWQSYTSLAESSASSAGNKRRRGKKARKKIARATARPSKREELPDELFVKDMQFSWPIHRDNFWLSSKFGPRKKPNGKPGFHYGIDMASMRGTPVKAAAGGVVIEAGRVYGYGNTILIAHNNKYKTRYAHLDKILVKRGQKVHRGMMIGKVGDTGFVHAKGKDASHLHFEVHAFGKQINPMHFLS